jgi:Protein of unknown function (DUF1344)
MRVAVWQNPRESVARRQPRFQGKQRRIIMRILGNLALAAALTATPVIAYAATTTGDISHINRAANSLVLDNGSSFQAPRGAELSHLKVGEKVKVAYAIRHGKLDALAIRPVNLNGNNPGLNANFGG